MKHVTVTHTRTSAGQILVACLAFLGAAYAEPFADTSWHGSEHQTPVTTLRKTMETRNASRPIYRRELIVGGYGADISRYPWAVFIGKQRGYGGSLSLLADEPEPRPLLETCCILVYLRMLEVVVRPLTRERFVRVSNEQARDRRTLHREPFVPRRGADSGSLHLPGNVSPRAPLTLPCGFARVPSDMALRLAASCF